MAGMTYMACMAHWLADLADPMAFGIIEGAWL